MALEVYRKKRDFKTTPEPRGRAVRKKAGMPLRYLIQKHRASHLHYDFRIELDGVLLSWAVPKGPSLDPRVKRLAMHVEDHPIEYGDFEGVIPPKQYGSGTVLLWDRGTWAPTGDPHEGYRKGKLNFTLHGEKLKGEWVLVRTGSARGDDDKSWFLIKRDDAYARSGAEAAITDMLPLSVASGRDLEAIAADPERVWHSTKSVADNVRTGAVKRTRPRLDLGKIDGASKAALPATMGAELATLTKESPTGAGWIYEIKYDGYRMLCRVANGEAALFSRNGNDWTAQAPTIARALARLPVREAWLDGELVVMDDQGKTSFQRLQNALGSGATAGLSLWLFDLLYLDGYDLRRVPLIERKAVLASLLGKAAGDLHYSGHVEGDGADVLAQACRLGLEGIIAKRRDAAYVSRRSADWLKVKCALRQEMVIGGYTDPRGSRSGLGALLLGVHDAQGRLRYAGKVGTGFNEASLADLTRRLTPRQRRTAPFVNPPRGYEAKGVHWVEPELVAEIAFTEWTNDGTARHPSFQGLREDKKASDVVLERSVPVDDAGSEAAPSAEVEAPARPAAAAKRARRSAPRATGETASTAGVVLSNPDKVLYPECGLTKRDLAHYYASVGKWIVPHIAQRPLTLLRCPNGWEQGCFYQKHINDRVAEAIESIEIEEGGAIQHYMMANSVEAIVSLLQMGVLEMHVWGSTARHLDRPDRLVFDLDPDEPLPWDQVVEAARLLRTLLQSLELEGFLRTTGGKGLHVVVPIRPTLVWASAKAFTKAVADVLVNAFPDRFTSKLAKVRRGGKIFIDYLRNGEGATAIASYSVRARAGAPVATPISWGELEQGVRPADFTVQTIPARLGKGFKDPWQRMPRVDQAIDAARMAKVGYREIR